MDRVDQLMADLRRESPEFATPEVELVKRVGRLAALVEEATREALSGFGITYAEFDVLATLRRAGKPYRLRPGQLARASMLTTGGTSNILQRLTASKLVVREADPNDRRGSWVRLTPEGVSAVRRISHATGRAYSSLLAPVAPETGRTLTDLLREVLLALDDRPPAE